MNHPNLEDWTPYVFDELDKPRRRELEDHLQHCAACRDEVAAWQRTVARLDAWKLPAPRARVIIAPVFKWAAAAAIILGIGFVAGRWSRPSAAEIAALARAEAQAVARSEMRGGLLMALAPENPAHADPFQRQLRQDVQTVLLRSNGDAFRTFQAEEHRATLALFKQSEQRQAAWYLSLRHDLETLAADADDRLQQNGREIVQLASTYRSARENP
jgi:hypothetical protein